jgi:L-lactate dehydrogenase complex protein LldG
MFTDRLTEVGGHVQLAADSASAARAIQTITAGNSDRTIWASSDVMQRAPGLVSHLRELGFVTNVPCGPVEVRDQPLGLAIAEGTVAETGSALISEPDLKSRAVTLVTETLIIVCPTSALMASLDDAATMLREISASGASYATLITGPSRTADIERQLTVGVQGPGVLHVILVDDLS